MTFAGGSSVVLAHTVGGPAGVEIELLLLAGGFLAAAWFFRPSQVGNARSAVVCLVIGLALGAGSFAVPRIGGPSGSSARVEILSPADGAKVKAGERVTVQVDLTGGRIAESPDAAGGGHLHVFIDNKVHSMPTSERVEVKFEPGEHEVRIEYVDSQHLSFDPPVVDSITITAN